MANPRTPVAKAEVSGAAAKNPQRHRAKAKPAVANIPAAPGHLTKPQKVAWAMFVGEMPWLGASDTAMLEIAARIRGDLAAGEDVGVTALSMYQSVLSKLGGSPSDRSKVSVPDGEQADPADKFFGRPN